MLPLFTVSDTDCFLLYSLDPGPEYKTNLIGMGPDPDYRNLFYCTCCYLNTVLFLFSRSSHIKSEIGESGFLDTTAGCGEFVEFYSLIRTVPYYAPHLLTSVQYCAVYRVPDRVRYGTNTCIAASLSVFFSCCYVSIIHSA